jgi:peptidoglycan/LPS O-acetylase OafA/YrhL
MRRAMIHPLTSVRFFAALAVVIFHYNRKLEIFPGDIANFGYEAVTFFFILSGFILTYTHGERVGMNVSISKFALSRFARIYPAYILALCIALPFSIKSASAGMALVPAMVQAWWPMASLLWNSPAWSLSNEMFFYAVYPAIWWTICRLPQPMVLLSAAMAVIAALVLKANTGFSHDFSAYFPVLNLPQFLLGVALGKQFIERGRFAYSNALLGVSTLSLGFVIFDRAPAGWDSAALCIIFGVMIYSLAGVEGLSKTVLSTKALVALGESSYAIYILHVPIWQWWDRVFRVQANILMSPHLDFATYLSFTILVSMLTTSLFERPARKWLTRAFNRERASEDLKPVVAS